MAFEPVKNDPAKLLDAVAFITEVPADEIDQWVVVAVKKDETFRIGSDLCCWGHAAMLLTATTADLMATVAAGMHATQN